tara:strand:- start:35 stop:448 length:414 start_codon:yes stop_codon:yes gene_type:complete
VVAEFTTDRTENARAARLSVLIYEYGGVFVESDVAAVRTTSFFSCSYDNAANDLALLHGGTGDGVLNSGDKDITNRRVAPSCTSEDSDAQNFSCPGIVGDFKSGFLLDHCINSEITGLVLRFQAAATASSSKEDGSP